MSVLFSFLYNLDESLLITKKMLFKITNKIHTMSIKENMI